MPWNTGETLLGDRDLTHSGAFSAGNLICRLITKLAETLARPERQDLR